MGGGSTRAGISTPRSFARLTLKTIAQAGASLIGGRPASRHQELYPLLTRELPHAIISSPKCCDLPATAPPLPPFPVESRAYRDRRNVPASQGRRPRCRWPQRYCRLRVAVRRPGNVLRRKRLRGPVVCAATPRKYASATGSYGRRPTPLSAQLAERDRRHQGDQMSAKVLVLYPQKRRQQLDALLSRQKLRHVAPSGIVGNAGPVRLRSSCVKLGDWNAQGCRNLIEADLRRSDLRPSHIFAPAETSRRRRWPISLDSFRAKAAAPVRGSDIPIDRVRFLGVRRS